MRLQHYTLVIFCLLMSNLLFAQNIAINTTGTVADASAMLDVTSTTKGVLIPRMTSAQRTAIVSPATGLLVYDNTLSLFYYYDGAAWRPLLNNNIAWNLTGNAGTAPATNFIGTTDDKALIFKTNNTQSGLISTGENLFLGYNAGRNDLSINNVGIGSNALYLNTTGNYNTALGFQALLSNVVGNENTGIGYKCLYFNTGSSNTGIGYNVMYDNTTGN
jgi:hypothetical protein